MKDAGVHENTIEHIDRLFRTQLYGGKTLRLDDAQRIRMDDVELADAIQDDVKRRWPIVSTENLGTLADLDGFRADFLKIFGFGFDGVDYEEDLDPALATL
jgi:enoyl-[acyl-carrier protein] reductase / trans-2-enoyl-CoA reductase (NAD+)